MEILDIDSIWLRYLKMSIPERGEDKSRESIKVGKITLLVS